MVAATTGLGGGTTLVGGSGTVAVARIRDRPWARGDTVGRYRVLGPLGTGGMGIVLSAYDPELDRRVALKFLRPRAATAQSTNRARLLREAEAMARLNHPNIVTVHDVGVHEGVVFVTMEYVDGLTVPRWLAETAPTWPEVLAIFIEAGHGLAAVHAEGLLHRDIKPDNIMVDSRGRARVMDFGLALVEDPTVAIREENRELSTTGGSGTDRLTRSGALVGTPAYMAPEQFLHEAIDPRTDQFSFCVALWESLYRERPFAGETMAQLAHAVLHGQRRAPPPAPAVPTWLRSALDRGLRANPSDRWASMDALLSALSRPTPRRRRQRLVLGSMTAFIGVTGTWLGLRAPAETCTGAEYQLRGVWDDRQRSNTMAAFERSGEAYADETWHRVAATLDDYRARWSTAYTKACEATVVHKTQTPEVMDLKLSCLRRAELSLQAVAATLADADAPVVRNAHKVVSDLPALSLCEDMETLEATVLPPPAADAQQVDRARALLARGKALLNAGDHDSALRMITRARALASTAGHGPLDAEIGVVEGMTLAKLGRTEEARAALEGVLWSALRNGPTIEMLDAASFLLSLIAQEQHRPNEAKRYVELAQNLLVQFPQREHDFRSAYGKLLQAQGHYEQAAVQYQQALELYSKRPGKNLTQLATIHINLANVLFEQARPAEAEEKHRKALEYYAAAVGPTHPDIALARHNFANALSIQGKREAAEREYRAAIEIARRALGDRHPHTVLFRSSFGSFLGDGDDLDQAEAELRAVIQIWEEEFDPQHHNVGGFRLNLAEVLLDQGRVLEAEEQQRMTVQLWENTVGSNHPDVALARNNLAGPLHSQGRYAEAEVEHRRALAIRTTALSSDHPDIASSSMFVADVLFEQDKPAEALPFAEQAWTRLQHSDIPAKRRGEAAFLLAKVAWANRGREADRSRATALAQTALDAFADSANDEEHAQVEAWLHEHAVH